MSVQDRITERRKQLNLELKETAHASGIEYAYFWKLENGVNEPPAWAVLAKLAKGLECTADYLLELSDDWRPASYAARPPLSRDEEHLLLLWRSLDSEQRSYILETLEKLQRWSQPRIIGEDHD